MYPFRDKPQKAAPVESEVWQAVSRGGHGEIFAAFHRREDGIAWLKAFHRKPFDLRAHVQDVLLVHTRLHADGQWSRTVDIRSEFPPR